MDFYTLGELHGLTGITHYRLGQGEQAEYHSHLCLAALRPEQHRNRAYYTAQSGSAKHSGCPSSGSPHGWRTGRRRRLRIPSSRHRSLAAR